jgi:CMP-N,N'-diacetyllegionaminic acid synthase
MLKLSDLIIDPSASLRSALQQMTANRCGVLFVCDENMHLTGVLSDGDVRRSLLDDTSMMVMISKIMNTDPILARTNAEARGLLEQFKIVAVPVVDGNGRIREAVVEDGGQVVTLAEEISLEEAMPNGALALIPARGGSKRIPRKNLAKVAGKTLLGWTVQAAKNSSQISHVIVSTDDKEIAEIGRDAGAEVPWMRPAELSADDTPALDVIIHALRWAVENLTPAPEFAVLLEPTAPLRRRGQIDQAIELLRNSDADSVASVCQLPHVFHPEELLLEVDGELRPYRADRTMHTRRLRNNQEPVYVLNGIVYAFRVQSVLASGTLFGAKTLPLVTPWEDYLDIDTPEDLALANLKLERSISHTY